MKIFKENPFLLLWMVCLTATVIFSFFHVKITVNLPAHENAKISIKSTRSSLKTGEK